MRRNSVRKQITVLVPVTDWKVMRDEATRRGLAVTELCRATLEPLLEVLRRAEEERDHTGPEIRDPGDNPRPRAPRNRSDHPWRGDV